ncbi:hypothetical protein TW74_23930 [Vibrio nigripulchritudo]|nr:hypothetical protein TW74_23930 [Vibrio nigripulchritudo]
MSEQFFDNNGFKEICIAKVFFESLPLSYFSIIGLNDIYLPRFFGSSVMLVQGSVDGRDILSVCSLETSSVVRLGHLLHNNSQ